MHDHISKCCIEGSPDSTAPSFSQAHLCTREVYTSKRYIYIYIYIYIDRYICFGRLWCSSYLLTYFLSLSPLCVCASIQSWSKIGYLPILVHGAVDRLATRRHYFFFYLVTRESKGGRQSTEGQWIHQVSKEEKWIGVKLVKLRIHYQNQYRIKVDFCRWVKKDFFVIKILIATNPHWISIACNQRKKKEVDYLGCTEKGLVSWAMFFLGISVCSQSGYHSFDNVENVTIIPRKEDLAKSGYKPQK